MHKLTIFLSVTMPFIALCQIPLSPIDWDVSKGVTVKYEPKDPLTGLNSFAELNSIDIENRNAKLIAEVDVFVEQQIAQRKKVNKIIDDGISEMPFIHYERKGPNIPGRERYYEAYIEITKMLNEEMPLNLKRAVFIVEAANNPTLDWDEFQNAIGDMVTHVGLKMQKDELNPDDNLGKVMSLFSLFTDTLALDYPNRENTLLPIRCSMTSMIFGDMEIRVSFQYLSSCKKVLDNATLFLFSI